MTCQMKITYRVQNDQTWIPYGVWHENSKLFVVYFERTINNMLFYESNSKMSAYAIKPLLCTQC